MHNSNALYTQANIGSKFPSKPTKPADIAGRWEGGDEGGRESVTGGAGGAGFGKLRGDVGGAVGSLGIASSFEPPSPGMEEARSFGFSSGQMVATPTPPPPPPTGSPGPPKLQLPPAVLSERSELRSESRGDRAKRAAAPQLMGAPMSGAAGGGAAEAVPLRTGPPRITRAHTCGD